MTFEHLKQTPLGAAHAVGQIYGVPTPGKGNTDSKMGLTISQLETGQFL